MYKEFLQYSSNLNVLFIENDESIREEFSNILKLFFNKVDVAADGLEGLHFFREFYLESDLYYDIVITEVDIPVISGEQLIKEIKLLNKNQAFVLTSDCNESDQLINFIKLGVKDFLKKPLSAIELQESLYQLSKNLSFVKEPQNNINFKDSEAKTSDDTIEFLRYDDNICLKQII